MKSNSIKIPIVNNMIKKGYIVYFMIDDSNNIHYYFNKIKK